MKKNRMLLLSFSNLISDARILRQIELFKDKFELTTCGYGPAPAGVTAHLRIPDSKQNADYSRLALLLHLYHYAYFQSSAVKFSYKLLAARKYDVVWANDFNTIPLALALKPSLGVHADLHEDFLTAENRSSRYRKFVQPFRVWILRKYLPKCRSITSVTATIANRYQELSGKPVGVVTNAAPFEDLSPSVVGHPLRLVHVGKGAPGRGIEEMIKATTDCNVDVKLDCYLVTDSNEYLGELKELASKSKGKVELLDPVPHDDLVRTMNDYDVSVIFVQPTHFSYKYCLPNKVFQSIQARLAIVTGPSPEIVSIVDQYGVGIVTQGFSVDDLRRGLDELTISDVREWKKAAGSAADELNSENESKGWLDSLTPWAF